MRLSIDITQVRRSGPDKRGWGRPRSQDLLPLGRIYSHWSRLCLHVRRGVERPFDLGDRCALPFSVTLQTTRILSMGSFIDDTLSCRTPAWRSKGFIHTHRLTDDGVLPLGALDIVVPSFQEEDIRAKPSYTIGDSDLKK